MKIETRKVGRRSPLCRVDARLNHIVQGGSSKITVGFLLQGRLTQK